MALETVLKSVLSGKCALTDSEDYTEEFLDGMFICTYSKCFLQYAFK